ncbi:MAG: thioredoxin family protein [Candidatus Brocadiaceae bacterium]|nr:thioredoxin family protein [Candidatus Brocadiaceae bacterium]
MALISSSMIPLGTVAPPFRLPDTVSGKTADLNDLKSEKATVIMFICNHCPYVKHVQTHLVRLANDYQPKGIAFVAISSNDATSYPEDAPEKMKEVALQMDYPFPYLYDETQEIARQYHAACTPDFYIFDDSLKCVYRGQLDDSRPGNQIPVTGKDIRSALDNILNGLPVSAEQKSSMGCSIKWKIS